MSKVFNGIKLPEFVEGEEMRVYAKKLNLQVMVLNSLLKMRIVRGGRDSIVLADANSLFMMKTDE